jgi:hypothetical protein
MADSKNLARDLAQLKNYVYETLCKLNELELGAFEITERALVRRNETCGLHFCVYGPRNVKLTAIWEKDANTVLFFGSNGGRVQRTKLQYCPAFN